MRTYNVANRLLIIAGLAVALSAITASGLLADIKTQEKTSFQMGGALGGLINKFAGDAAKDGVVNSIAVRGSRKMTSKPGEQKTKAFYTAIPAGFKEKK